MTGKRGVKVAIQGWAIQYYRYIFLGMGMECIGKEKSMKEILHNGDVN